MTNKKPEKKIPKPSKNYPRKTVPVYEGKTDQEFGRNYAAMLTAPELAAYRVINGAEYKSGLGDQIDVPTLLEQLRDSAAAVNRGSLAQAEAMLMNQSTALQSLFARLAERGMSCNDAAPFEANMRMALRAQSQCRATLETLATIKNPPQVAFVKQANIAAGPQQVNNGVVPEASRAGKNENQQSKQSGGSNELLPDARASQVESRINPQMEAVGKIDRA